jgi:monofunctional biosynthetic peptidoglycan transglycosylase
MPSGDEQDHAGQDGTAPTRAAPAGSATDKAAPERPKRSMIRRLFWLGCRIAGSFLLISVVWAAIYSIVPVPLTPLMVIRLVEGHGFAKDWVPYERISPNLARAAIASEDSGFCAHHGFEWEAIQNAWDRNQRSKRIRGGSTISNQTAKNAFLWPDRTYARKVLEYYFTALIELFWGKKRILEVYLNVVEFGPGIYGAEAAAQTYFKKPASALNRREAALMVAVLPSPLKWSVTKPGPYVQSRTATIMARMLDIPDPTGDPCPARPR